MSVKIQILDYVKGNSSNQVSFDTGTTATGWSVSETSNQMADWDGSVASGLTYFENVSLPLIVGHEYIITLTITNYSGTGNIGISSENSSGVANGVGTSLRSASNTTITETITCTAEGSIKTFAYNTNSGTIQVSVIDTAGVDWDKSIVGELDVTDHSEFPLAMTFQISDIKDITSTSGDYSKTFKIPATKNNNNLLKHLYTPNSINTNSATENKPCEILVNDLYSLIGTIKVTGIGGYGEKASYYNCVFYGNNLSWALELDNEYMNTIDWGNDGATPPNYYGEDLVYQKPDIIATWQHATSSIENPIVYPITSYGQMNESVSEPVLQLLDSKYAALGTGSSGTIGYYGYFNSGNSYGTPSPVADWRPAVFVKNTLDRIFQKIGYTINSTFMNTDNFKKLVWLLPNFSYNNPDSRYEKYAVETNWVNGYTFNLPADSPIPAGDPENIVAKFYDGSIREDNSDTGCTSNCNDYKYTGAGRQDFELFNSGSQENINIILDDNSRLDFANNYITIGTHGNYDIRIKGLKVKVARIHKGGTDDKEIQRVDAAINVEVQTVGQSSWNIIGQLEQEMNPQTASGSTEVDYNSPAFTDYINLQDFEILGRYFNKNDKIRLTKGARILSNDNNQDFILYIFWQTRGGSSFDVSLNPEIVNYGETYNLNDVIDKDYKQVDFIKGISHAFNLKMTTDQTTKTINIEPFNTFYQPYGSAIDWTYKLDRSREANDKFLKSDLKQKFIFKYKTDNKDATVQYRGERFFDKVEDEYPYQETLGSNFERGESIFENPFFAGTFNAQDQDTTGLGRIDNPFSACLWQEKDDNTITSANDWSRPPKGNDFLPRLLYWNKYSPASQASSEKIAKVQTFTTSVFTIKADATATSPEILSNIYPQATSINGHDKDSPVLSYGNVYIRDYDDATGNYASSTIGQGLYATYYRNMFEMFKLNPRLRTVFIDLKITDIVNLDFTKLIYLDGVYWKLNKINDYMPNNNKPTKVELIEWFEIGTFASQAPAFGSSGGSSGGVHGWGGLPSYDVVLNPNNST